MNKFINETLVIYISKFTNTKVIKALKDGMMFSLPFLMIGSLFLLIANLPIESVSKVISESGIGDVCSQVYSSTFSLMAFFTVIGITYSYLKNDQVITAINGALTGLAAFILLTPSSKVLDSGESVTGIISKDWTAGQGMICAILIGFLVGYIYSLCVKKDISIKMPMVCLVVLQIHFRHYYQLELLLLFVQLFMLYVTLYLIQHLQNLFIR